MPYIEFSDVVRSYGEGGAKINALDGASFVVEKGELAVILGASGAGKTTALNILGGMDSATSGKVVVGGREGVRPRGRLLPRQGRRRPRRRRRARAHRAARLALTRRAGGGCRPPGAR